ncbi:MAG: hypothetical protein PVF47_19035 [Anaerolineae bacterium]|jgi:hypothetical protein
MQNRASRWHWLTILAVANLVIWVALAGLVGLVVGDKLNLGVETMLRQGQATAAVAWEQMAEGSGAPASNGPASDGPGAPAAGPVTNMPTQATQAQVATAVQWPAQPEAQATAGPEPIATSAFATPALNPAGMTVVVAEPTATQPAATETVPPSQSPTEPALLHTPLLLSDPEIHSLASLDAQMKHSASGRPVQIRYQETTLNREVAQLSEHNPDLPFRDVNIDLKREAVVLTGKVTVLGFQVDATVTGQVTVEECLPHLEIESVAVAGIMTPRFVRDEVEKMVMDAMTWYPADYPLCLEQIVLEETRATVYGHRR